jgi:hypothetical protein
MPKGFVGYIQMRTLNQFKVRSLVIISILIGQTGCAQLTPTKTGFTTVNTANTANQLNNNQTTNIAQGNMQAATIEITNCI